MSEEEKTELKRCPFCGAAVELTSNEISTEDETYGYWAVECLRHANLDASLFCGVHADEPEQAIAIWNRRPAITALKEEIRADERRKCWEEINALIQSGPLPGMGCDPSAQRNGLILAANTLHAPRAMKAKEPL